MDSFLISVVIPMYYEQEVATACYQRLTEVLRGKYRYELIFVNDGSKDNTLPILRDIATEDRCVRVISFARNFGHQYAVTAGVDASRGDAVVVIDADLQDPPELIPDMIALWQQGSDVVYAKRKARKGESVFKRFTASMFYRVLRGVTDTDIPADTGDFRLMDRKVVKALARMPEHNRFLRGMVAWLGFKQTPIEYVRDERLAGVTKYPLKKMMKFAGDGILSFSTKPLRWVANLGLVSVLVAIGIAIYAFINLIIGNTQPGWVSTILTITFFGGVQLLSLGVVGAYVGRIYEEVRQRPLYIEAERINFDVQEE
ncbi:MAG: glycosyltransferase family 2 protein [Christensenellales bacterium]|jgi:glycosyltransferase involved in cell wall biosynthesis